MFFANSEVSMLLNERLTRIRTLLLPPDPPCCGLPLNGRTRAFRSLVSEDVRAGTRPIFRISALMK
jgi:hypothetical protein